MTPNLETNLGGLKMKNPVTVASGTFGYGQEYDQYFDIARLGAVTTKSLSLEVRAGNKPPRLVETPAGMLNAIGLQNVGIDVYLNEKAPWLRDKGVAIIANIYGTPRTNTRSWLGVWRRRERPMRSRRTSRVRTGMTRSARKARALSRKCRNR